VFEKMSERAERLIVMMHGVQESDAKEISRVKRTGWGIKETEKVIKILEPSLTRENVKF
jgi:hypothetical protein